MAKLYEQLANDLKVRIDNGLYQSGDRLPSVRELCRDHGVSASTVQLAFRLLERENWIEARARSGYFVRPRHQVLRRLPRTTRPPARPQDVTEWSTALDMLCSTEYQGVVSLGVGVPDLSGPALRPLIKQLTGNSSTAAVQRLGYGAVAGALSLREQIARIAVNSGCSLDPDEILITTGCQEALSCAVRAVTRPGDVVAIDSPSFFGALLAISSCGAKAMEIPTCPEQGVSLTALELALEQWPISAILLTPTCNNPLGYTMNEARRIQLLELARRFDVVIIEDDIYGDLSFGYPRARSIKSYDTEGRVILCSSFSKTLGPGLRVGWVAAGRYRERVLQMKYVSSGTCAMPSQLAVAAFIESGDYERHVRRSRLRYRQQRDKMLALLQHYLPEEVRYSDPQGGFLLWVEMPEQIDTIALDERLAPQGVKIAPGPLFSVLGKYRNCIRLNYACEIDDGTERAIRLLGVALHDMLRETRTFEA